jgi:predicted DNA-binding protein
MSDQISGESRHYKIVMSEEGYRAFHKLAEEDGNRPLADIFREAMQEYLDRRGIDASVRVKRGGYREGAGKKPNKDAGDE